MWSPISASHLSNECSPLDFGMIAPGFQNPPPEAPRHEKLVIILRNGACLASPDQPPSDRRLLAPRPFSGRHGDDRRVDGDADRGRGPRRDRPLRLGVRRLHAHGDRYLAHLWEARGPLRPETGDARRPRPVPGRLLPLRSRRQHEHTHPFPGDSGAWRRRDPAHRLDHRGRPLRRAPACPDTGDPRSGLGACRPDRSGPRRGDRPLALLALGVLCEYSVGPWVRGGTDPRLS